jgi:ubiquinone/menaquinone biosynthesis C-methylase UbiE
MLKLLISLNNALFPGWMVHLKKELRGCESVLDMGCGSDSPIQNCNVKFSLGVELFDPYLAESKKKKIHTEYLKADIKSVEFKPKSFDCVMCLEVLEHMTKEEGLKLIEKMKKWARKKVIITTPNTFVWQDEIDNNPLQAHVSGWSAKELRNIGFKVHGIEGWKKLRGYRGVLKYKPMFFWAKIAHISQKLVYFFPSMAFQLFAVSYTDADKLL